MKFFLAFIFCQFFAVVHAGEKKADQLFEQGEYREAIEAYQQAFTDSTKEKQGDLKKKIAISFYRDQEDEKAFKAFLEALSLAPQLKTGAVSPEEQKLYEEALQIYLEHTGPAAREAATQIREMYSPVVAIHSDYYQLNFIMAAAYANLGMFEEFFDRFYRSYEHFPESYMAYKTKAILYLKLYEKARTEEEKESQKKSIFFNAMKASQQNPKDASLYRILITFSTEKEHQTLLNSYLNKIIDDNIVIPRTDLFFYVKESVDANNVNLAQKFIEKAKGWYSYSKMIELSEEYIAHKKDETK